MTTTFSFYPHGYSIHPAWSDALQPWALYDRASTTRQSENGMRQSTVEAFLQYTTANRIEVVRSNMELGFGVAFLDVVSGGLRATKKTRPALFLALENPRIKTIVCQGGGSRWTRSGHLESRRMLKLAWKYGKTVIIPHSAASTGFMETLWEILDHNKKEILTRWGLKEENLT